MTKVVAFGYVCVVGVLTMTIWYVAFRGAAAISSYTTVDYLIAVYGFLSAVIIFFWMLFDYIRNYKYLTHRAWWLLAFIFTSYVGAVLYFLTVFANRRRTSREKPRGQST